MTYQLEIQAIGALVAVACALPGCFLVLRRMAMLSDAISHAILLGIVLAFFITRDLSSPWLVLGAAAAGLATVALVEALERTGRVREDAAIGLVFPLLFSAGVILIARYAGSIHLDTDAVLLGELGLAPFDRFVAAGRDLGPKAMWVMGGVLLLNIAVIGLLYKELKLVTFDPALAASLGFAPVLVHYGLMALVSVTAVTAFNAVGSVLVVALMVAPPAAAFMLTQRLRTMLALAALFGAISAVGGYWLAHLLDANIAGAMTTVAGAGFTAALLFAPERGLVAQARLRRRHRLDFGLRLLMVHLLHHQDRPEAAEETRTDALHLHLRWTPGLTARIVHRGLERHLLARDGPRIRLTPAGADAARRAIEGR